MISTNKELLVKRHLIPQSMKHYFLKSYLTYRPTPFLIPSTEFYILFGKICNADLTDLTYRLTPFNLTN